MSDFNSKTLGRCLCIITGASKGFGLSLAQQGIRMGRGVLQGKLKHLEEPCTDTGRTCKLLCRSQDLVSVKYRTTVPLAKKVPSLLEAGSALILVARTGKLLQELKTELVNLGVSQGLVVWCVAADLSAAEGVAETLQAAKQQNVNDYDHVLLINNAGSLGSISQFSSFTDPAEVNAYISFNVSSALALTAGVLQAFPHRPGLKRTVVNVSSMFAQEPHPRWVLYCTAKAARYMMFKVLAEEEPDVKVLSYSPGPMDTEMQQEIFKQISITQELMSCEKPGSKLLMLVLDSDYSSGAHIDFFDAC